MRNVIGVSCTQFSKEPFLDIYGLVSKEFSHWEIFSELDHYGPTVARDHCDLIGSSNLTFSLHTGIGDINVASTNERIRETSLFNIFSEMEAANKLGIETLTIHPGIINMAVKGTRDRSLVQANRSMKEIERAADEYGVCACIENMPAFPVMLGIEASELATIVDGTDLPICFDIGHANTSGQIEAMVELFGNRIRNVHIHDNLGEKDDHMTIGDGKIDFAYVLGLLKNYTHRYIIEAKSIESAVISKARLEKLLDH